MGYMLPLRFIEVSTKPPVCICATRIVAMMSTDIYQARRTIHEEKKSGTLINACGTSAAKTAILLDNGSVVSSPRTIPVLLKAIEKSNSKANAKVTARLKVYDVYDEEPSSEIDDIVSEISMFDEVDLITAFYVKKIKAGEITLKDVPSKWQKTIKDALEKKPPKIDEDDEDYEDNFMMDDEDDEEDE